MIFTRIHRRSGPPVRWARGRSRSAPSRPAGWIRGLGWPSSDDQRLPPWCRCRTQWMARDRVLWRICTKYIENFQAVCLEKYSFI